MQTNFVEEMREEVKANPKEYPVMSRFTPAMWESPFMGQYLEDGLALERGEEILSLNGKPMGHAVYNLLISKRDLEMWIRMKMKPHRRWKVSHVKKYFGIKGNGENLMNQFMLLYNNIHEGQL